MMYSGQYQSFTTKTEGRLIFETTRAINHPVLTPIINQLY